MRFLRLMLSFLGFFIVSCSNGSENELQESDGPDSETGAVPNILLIIADDMGLDATPGYELGDERKPNTPNLSNLASTGIRYTNVWSYPTCTPTRGSIITGKYGFRTGITKVGDLLNSTEITLQEHIGQTTGYATAVIGKWHLGIGASDTHPNDVGVGHYAGSLTGSVNSYTNWDLTINGVTNSESEYITSKYTDLAIDWIAQQNNPWFLWLAHNAPHDPYEFPPESLYNAENLPAIDGDIFTEDQQKYFAMIEAMDQEIGRLLASMDKTSRENTIIIFVGDNGTGGRVSQVYNSRRTKGSVYRGGVNVPMIVSGGGMSRVNTVDDSLIATVDLFATITELATGNPSNMNDSVSFVSTFTDTNMNPRKYLFTEIENNDGTYDRAIRNETHKYISFENGMNKSFFNLENNPFENPDLLSASQLPMSESNVVQMNELMVAMNGLLAN